MSGGGSSISSSSTSSTANVKKMAIIGEPKKEKKPKEIKEVPPGMFIFFIGKNKQCRNFSLVKNKQYWWFL